MKTAEDLRNEYIKKHGVIYLGTEHLYTEWLEQKLLASQSQQSGEGELERLYNWLLDRFKREPAKTKFTEGMLRKVAQEIEYQIHDAEWKPILKEHFESAPPKEQEEGEEDNLANELINKHVLLGDCLWVETKRQIIRAMKEYATHREIKVPTKEEIEKNATEGGLRDNEAQMFYEGALWAINRINQINGGGG